MCVEHIIIMDSDTDSVSSGYHSPADESSDSELDAVEIIVNNLNDPYLAELLTFFRMHLTINFPYQTFTRSQIEFRLANYLHLFQNISTHAKIDATGLVQALRQNIPPANRTFPSIDEYITAASVVLGDSMRDYINNYRLGQH